MRQVVVLALSIVVGVGVVSAAEGRQAGSRRSVSGGRQLWVARYDGASHALDAPGMVATSPVGSRVFVVGQDEADTDHAGFVTIAYDAATGSQLWLRRLGDAPGAANAVAVSPDGSRVFVTGWVVGSGQDYATVAYDAATGDEVWVARYASKGRRADLAESIAVSPDGSRLIVTGTSEVSESIWDFATVAYDAATGAQEWVRRHKGRLTESPIGASVAFSPDGARAFVTGGREAPLDSDPTHPDFVTLAYDPATGRRLWERRYTYLSEFLSGSTPSLAVSPDGAKVFVTGSITRTRLDFDYVTIAYDASSGAKLWQRRYRGHRRSTEQAFGVAVSPDGTKVADTGETSGDVTQIATVVEDAVDGKRLWVRRYAGTAEAHGYALAFAPSGSQLYVVGSSDSDYATIAYDTATGDRLWVRRYHSPYGRGWAYSLAVSPDGGSIYVTGRSKGAGGYFDYDFATIAYSAG